MPAYIIALVDVTDWDQYRQYTKATPAVIDHFGGKFVVRGGKMAALEGPEETRRVVVLEFPTFERAQEFFHSEEYSRVRKLREGAANGQFFVVDGYPGA